MKVSVGNAGLHASLRNPPPTDEEVGVLGAQRAALPAALLVAGLVVAGCGPVGGTAAQRAVPAVGPASAPPGGPAPAGTVLPLGAPATEVAFDPRSRTVAVALVDPPRLLLQALDGTAPPRLVPLPGAAGDLQMAAAGGPFLVPVSAPGCLIEVPLGGEPPARIDLIGSPRGAAAVGATTVVALGDRLAALEGTRLRRSIPGFVDAARVLPAGGADVWVLDRGRTAVSVVDLSSGEISPELRAGNGSANATVDRFGRMLVTDTRDGELLAFAGNPPVLRQRFPLPGAPYGLAYDAQRNLAWVTLTARDEVVGLSLTGGEPVVIHRLPAVHRPDAVAVDPVSGRVLVGSASGAGLQVIDPERVMQ